MEWKHTFAIISRITYYVKLSLFLEEVNEALSNLQGKREFVRFKNLAFVSDVWRH